MAGAWWAAKLACGVLLAAEVAAGALAGSLDAKSGLLPMRAAQALVAGGAAIELWHYALLKRLAGKLAEPARLVARSGLFGLVRHPMYLGDLVMYTGLALLAASATSTAVLLVATGAIIGLCDTEDRAMRGRFGAAHARWSRRTSMLIPGVL